MSLYQLVTACSRTPKCFPIKASIRQNSTSLSSLRFPWPNHQRRSGFSAPSSALLQDNHRNLIGRPSSTFSRAFASAATSSAPPQSSKTPKKFLYPSVFVGLLASITAYYLSSTRVPAPQLSVQHFTALKLLSKESLTADTTLYTLALPKELLPKEGDALVSSDPIRSVYVMQPELQIQRAYTVRPSFPHIYFHGDQLTH